MKEIFDLLEEEQYSVRKLTDFLKKSDENITLNLIDSLLRHYHRLGYLRREKQPLNNNKYAYFLSNKGEAQLDWLENNGHLEYQKKKD